MSNRETLKSALDRIVREIVDATLAAIREASVAEIAAHAHAHKASAPKTQKGGSAKPAANASNTSNGVVRRRTKAPAERRVVPSSARTGGRAPQVEVPEIEAAAGTAITDPESVLAAFFETPRPSRPRAEREMPALLASPPAAPARPAPPPSSELPQGSAPPSSAAAASSPTSETAPVVSETSAAPMLRENETAVRTAGGGVVIRRRRSPVQAA